MRFIAKIEHLIHLDLAYFITGGFWLGAGQLGALFLSFVSSLVFARFLSAETYGTYRYLSSIIVIISLFSLTGLGTALTQAVASGKTGTLRVAFAAQFRWTLLILIVSFALGFYALWHKNNIFFFIFMVFGVTGPLYFASGLYDAFLSGQGKFRLETIYQLFTNSVTSLFLIAAAFTGSFFLVLFPGLYAVQTLLSSFIYSRIVKTVPKNAPIDYKAVSYGKHLSLINILAVVADQADNIIIFIVAGPVNLAVYSFAIAIPEVIKGFLKTINPLSLPKLASTDIKVFRRTLPVRLFQILFVTAGIIFTYIISAPIIFNVFFPAYQRAIVYSQFFALSLLATPFYYVYAYFQANKMIKPIFLISTFSPIAQIILMGGFTLFWGLPGLVAARILGRIANLFFSLILVNL